MSDPAGGATLGAIALETLTIINNSSTTSLTFVVDNTSDAGPGQSEASDHRREQ